MSDSNDNTNSEYFSCVSSLSEEDEEKICDVSERITPGKINWKHRIEYHKNRKIHEYETEIAKLKKQIKELQWSKKFYYDLEEKMKEKKAGKGE